MQERIGLAALRAPLAIAVPPGIVEDAVVLGVLEEDGERDLFQRAERRLRARPGPEIEEEIARLVAGGIEHSGWRSELRVPALLGKGALRVDRAASAQRLLR